MAYFNYFPTVGYDVRGRKDKIKFDLVTNVLVRIRKKLEITNAAIFEQYFIRDGDRADTLAYQFYDDSTLHWIIMYANYITNPYYDWPLTYYDLQKYITKKYDNPNGIHHYEDDDKYEVDSNAPGATAITNSIYEEILNDEKRTINIIRPEYIPQIVSEFKKLM
tara:strand:- start:272 stop:763 length:492 start_codon:yes stop_codon:yes gene_type:complete